jgi:hypothetical protein
MLDVLLGGSLNQMWNMFCPDKSTYCIVGAVKVLGPKGFWGVELITLTDLALNFYSISERKPCLNNRVDLCGDYVVDCELYFHVKQLVNSRKEIKMSDQSLVVHSI